MEDKQQLKSAVENFLQQQSLYDPQKRVCIMCDQDLCFILYGPDIHSGVAGFGETSESALSDFKDNWHSYVQNGSDWSG